jgi:integrase
LSSRRALGKLLENSPVPLGRTGRGCGAIVRNPATRVLTPKIKQQRPWVLTMEEVDALVEAIPDRYQALVLLAAYGSLRWSELVALRIDRLSLPRHRVWVEEKIVESGHLIRGEPKTKRSRLWVAVPDFVALALAEHVNKYPPGSNGLVFTAPKGGPIRRPPFTGVSGPRPPALPASKVSPSATCVTQAQHLRSKKGRTQSWWHFVSDMHRQR